MKKFFICALMVACLCAGSASAEFGSTDSSNLSSIKNAMTYTGKSVAQLLYEIGSDTDYLKNISDNSNALNYLGFSLNHTMQDELEALRSLIGSGTSAYPSLMSYLSRTNILLTDLGDILSSTDSGSISDLLNKILTQSTTTATYQKYLTNTTTIGLWALNESGTPVKTSEISSNILGWLGQIYSNLIWDGINPHTYERTLYSRIAQLQEVLASDDDLELAESQRDNREQIETDFLNGDSGLTSLGSGDFADIAQVGGIISSSFSDAGTDVDGFVTRLYRTNTDAEGWFSSECAQALDSVTSTVSSYSLRDSDPYNMSGFAERYAVTKGGYDFDY